MATRQTLSSDARGAVANLYESWHMTLILQRSHIWPRRTAGDFLSVMVTAGSAATGDTKVNLRQSAPWILTVAHL